MGLFDQEDGSRQSPYRTNYEFIDSQSEFDRHYDEVMRLPYWVGDTETTGLKFLHDKVILLQVGNKSRQFLYDTRFVDVSRLKERFEDDRFVKIFQNAPFDYKMMKHSLGITMEGMLDPELAERILVAGLQKAGFGMASLCLKYLGVKISKEMQTSFINHQGPFSRRQKEYAALDCVYPDCYLPKQSAILEREGLKDTFILECDAIAAFADIEYYGMLLDAKAWEANIIEEKRLSGEARERFADYIAPFVGTDLFGAPDINPASPDQILRAFEDIYPPNLLLDPDNRDENDKPKKGTGAKVLENLVAESKHPDLAKSLMEFREHEKKIGTYGYTYINHIDATTGRFHPRIGQIGTDTGRPSGKKPNMLNIPRDGRYRTPWICAEGRKMLTNDYGACELRIMASMSGDPVMCKGFNDGLDYHTYTASTFIKDQKAWVQEFIPGAEVGKGKWGKFILDHNGDKIRNPEYGQFIKYEEVTKKQRNVAKTINFGEPMQVRPNKNLLNSGNSDRVVAKTILSESSGNIGSVQRLTAETDRLWLGTKVNTVECFC